MRSAFFYISGHGFGHAVRQIEIINALQRLQTPLRIVVRTDAPDWLFARGVSGAVTILPGQTDTGVVQLDGLRLDAGATMERAAAFYDALPELVAEEAALLRAHDAVLAMADAPPLACAAAEAAGIPSVVCANFTWDWIYEAYAEDPRDGRVIEAVRRAYRTAAGWRMPFHGGFGAVSTLRDVPLVARHARRDRTRDEVRSALGLPPAVRLVLASFGGYGVNDLPLDRIDCLGAWQVVVTTRNGDAGGPPAGVHAVPESRLYAAGLRYEDLVRAVDVVLTKPGYGIISDCIANDTAVLYTSRGRFAEYDVLVREMPRFLRCAFLEMERFLEGKWAAGLSAVEAAPPARERLRTDGAETVARLILKSCPGGPAAPPETGRAFGA